jgi:hypothetical protein
MSRTHPGTSLVMNFLLLSAIVLMTLTGVVSWWGYVEFQFEPGQVDPADYQGAITVALVTAVLLVLVGVPTVWAHAGGRFLYVVILLGVLVQLLVVAGCWHGAHLPPDPGVISHEELSLRLTLPVAFELPTSWPLFLLALAVTLRGVRAPSSPAPRPRPAPPAAPGRQRST